MKRIAIACIIAVLLCAGCRESFQNTNDEKSEMTSHSEDSRETSSETAATENTTTENTVTENVTSRTTENKHETVSTTVSAEKSSYLFTAKSGTGKSTHTRLWREYFGKRAVMVNDDKPLLQITENGVTVYGTPWDGKHHLSSNISIPLKAICILGRAEKNHIEKITKSIAYPMLIQQTYKSQNTEKVRKILGILSSIADNINLYHAGFNMYIEAAEIAYNMMKG